MNKSITLLTGSLLLVSNLALADRPAMSERTEAFELEPMVEEISPSIEEMPAATQEMEPMVEDMSAVEVEMQQEQQSTEEIPAAVSSGDAEPAIHVYDHRTDTEITGTVLTGEPVELQPGETLPVRVLDFPRRGMSMDKVRNELGEPMMMSDAIGEPPITTWTYRDRVVYFEYSSVIHVVEAN